MIDKLSAALKVVEEALDEASDHCAPDGDYCRCPFCEVIREYRAAPEPEVRAWECEMHGIFLVPRPNNICGQFVASEKNGLCKRTLHALGRLPEVRK